MSSTVQLEPATAYFPMKEARPAQVEALEFISRAVSKGYDDIVIAAPTGIGKSGIGVAACLWADSFEVAGYERGGYYLVTQKMLQDQLENDFPRFLPKFRTDAGSLKSSSEYPCRRFITCMAGGMASAEGEKSSGKRCEQRANKTCPYTYAKSRFEMSKAAVTNYPYLFTEHTYLGNLKPRNLLVADECFPFNTPIITNQGDIPIGELAKMKRLPKALCWNGCEFVYKQIVKAWSTGKQHLIRISTARGDILSTPNHKFLTSRGWKQAKTLSPTDELLCRREDKCTKELGPDQTQLLIGSYLGNGSVDTVSGGFRLVWTHSSDQSAYCRWKTSLLHGHTRLLHKNGFSQKPALRGISCTFSCSLPLLRPKSTVPLWMLDGLNAKGLAIWFMDDGSSHAPNQSVFHTEGFSRKTCTALATCLQRKFDITATLHRSKKHCWILRLGHAATQKLFSIIRPYMHPALAYKIHDKADGRGNWKTDFRPNKSRVKRTAPVRTLNGRHLQKTECFDLEVADNHNFLCRALLSKSRSAWSKTAYIAHNCHTLEKQITSFVEVVVNKDTLEAWAPDCRPVPIMNDILDFARWLRHTYLVPCNVRMEMLTANLEVCDYSNRRMQEEFNKLKNHVGRIAFAIDAMEDSPNDWVYWQEDVDGELQCTAKPISAAPFMPSLIDDMSSVRLYMSAYPGPKDVFCRSLGLDPKGVAWLDMDSPFPLENRLVHLTTVGSMSRRYADATLPKLLRMCETILESHAQEKGIIHCFDKETRLLTQRGLIPVLGLVASDKIMTLNPKTHKMEWQTSLFTFSKYASKLVKVSNRSLDFCVTPEHLIYAIPGRNGRKRTLVEAGKLIGGCRIFGKKKAHYFKVPRTGHWKGKYFKLGPLHGLAGAEFLGWFLAKGSAHQTIWKNKRQRCVTIAQTAIAKTPIPALCRRLGFHPYINPSQPDQLIIQNKALWTALRQSCYDGKGFGCFHKSAPNAIKEATKECIQKCVEAMVKGDGSRSSNNGKRAGQAHLRYCTVSKKLCEDTVELAIKSGYSACFRHVDSTRWKPSKINGRTVKRGKIYVVEIGVGATNAWFHSSELQQLDCFELVACPVTKNGIVFAERNGKTYWSGNCHSYALGQKIYEYFRTTPLANRVLFSAKASERAAHFNRHRMTDAPTVMLSPSIAEGFSFDDDLARFQIIAKVPYPYLGDRQVAARMEIDRDWYTLQTVMTVLQACGRIVRSETDHGATYILDSDFRRLYEDNSKFFPKWFREAFQFYQ